jgi:hypothetical protein
MKNFFVRAPNVFWRGDQNLCHRKPLVAAGYRRHLDAKGEYDCYVKQREKFPELKNHPTHTRDLLHDRAAWLALLRTLTGASWRLPT